MGPSRAFVAPSPPLPLRLRRLPPPLTPGELWQGGSSREARGWGPARVPAGRALLAWQGSLARGRGGGVLQYPGQVPPCRKGISLPWAVRFSPLALPRTCIPSLQSALALPLPPSVALMARPPTESPPNAPCRHTCDKVVGPACLPACPSTYCLHSCPLAGAPCCRGCWARPHSRLWTARWCALSPTPLSSPPPCPPSAPPAPPTSQIPPQTLP